MASIRRCEDLAANRRWLQLQDEARIALESDPGNRKLIHLRGLALANAGALDAAEALIRPEIAPELERPELLVHAAGLLSALANPDSDPDRRAGDVGAATQVFRAMLSSLDPGGAADEADISELLGLYARIQKERWARGAPDDRLAAAHRAYRLGYERNGNLFLGINAAATAWLAGRSDDAARLAARVLQACQKVSAAQRDYWNLATEGEARLLLGDFTQAGRAFELARSVPDVTAQQRESTGRQLRLLARAGVAVPASILEAYRPPRLVVLVSGGLTARSAVQRGGLGDAESSRMRAVIEAELSRLGECVGYCSAVPGPDLLFAELMLEHGCELNLVLPMEAGEFLRLWVQPAGKRWVHRFRTALRLADSTSVAARGAFASDAWLLAHTHRVLIGRAWMRSSEFGSEPALVECSRTPGATAHVCISPSRAEVARLVDGDTVRNAAASGGDPCVSLEEGRERLQAAPRMLATLLFGDLRGYSRLRDEHYATFLEFSSAIHDFLKRTARRPDFLRTTGDGLFAVCGTKAAPGSAATLAEFALGLQDAIRAANERAPMPDGQPMEMRIALHAGPIFSIDDPFTSFADYFGSNVNRTARLEPVTVPGQIYVTEPFAALLEFERITGSGPESNARCELVGDVELAKGFGIERVFVLRRSDRDAVVR